MTFGTKIQLQLEKKMTDLQKKISGLTEEQGGLFQHGMDFLSDFGMFLELAKSLPEEDLRRTVLAKALKEIKNLLKTLS